MSEKGKKAKEAAKKVARGNEAKDKHDETPKSGPMGGGSSEVNESAGSKVKT